MPPPYVNCWKSVNHAACLCDLFPVLACSCLEKKKKKTKIHWGETPGWQQPWRRLLFQCGKWGPCHYVPPVRINCGRSSCSLWCCALFHTCMSSCVQSLRPDSQLHPPQLWSERVQLLTLGQAGEHWATSYSSELTLLTPRSDVITFSFSFLFFFGKIWHLSDDIFWRCGWERL